MTIKEILEFNFINIGDLSLSLYLLITAFIILTLARILIYIVNRLIRQYFKRRNVETGRQFAYTQFTKYIIYTGGLLMAMEALGISLSVVWGGAAALLVGIGLGLQQTFNDLISGFILLIEGTVEVDDVIEVDGIVGKVTSIGIRTSNVESLDRISILIPNSKLVGEKATNWSHNKSYSRFHVNVGVAYSSDVDLVTRLLLQAAKEQEQVMKTPAPSVQFKDFGNSSLDFTLLFFSKDYLTIEFVKSEIRYKTTRLFRENDIEIPFPQQDLWLRNPSDLNFRK